MLKENLFVIHTSMKKFLQEAEKFIGLTTQLNSKACILKL